MKILVIEDQHILSRNLIRYLAMQDIRAQASFDGADGEYQASTKYFDAIVLDINLPERDGLTVCKNLREKGVVTPIIMLTSRGTSGDIVTGLDAGADDYLVKPFDYDELLARLRSLARRQNANKSTTLIKHGPLTLDLQNKSAEFQGSEVELSEKEFLLLSTFAKNPGHTLSRERLYQAVWGESDNDFTAGKTLDVYIGYLRKKLEKDLIETKKGLGYSLKNYETNT